MRYNQKTTGPEFTTHTLPCGLRIICAPGQTDVVYCGIAVDAGTRHETDSESGMAHFTEHMSFKGTARRTSRQIISAMEGVGGELNAFTGKEETVYYCTFLRQHIARAVDLLVDITLGSTFPQEEMDKEVEVVIDEIESYQDQPAEMVYDEFESLIFPGHPLGRNILGEADALHGFRTADMQRFTRRLYHPARMVLYVLGNVSPEHVIRLAEKAVARYDLLPQPVLQPAQAPLPQTFTAHTGHTVRRKDTHQAHVVIGAQSFGATDPRHLHIYFLSNMLGGPAMSSRLNLALRERNGLVYTVESNSVCYTDAGQWTIYFGCDREDRARCRRLARHELQRLTDAPLSQRALDAARRQLKGQIGISYDNYENVAIGMAKRYLHYGKTQTQAELFELLDALTPDQLLATAQAVFAPERLLTLEYV